MLHAECRKVGDDLRGARSSATAPVEFAETHAMLYAGAQQGADVPVLMMRNGTGAFGFYRGTQIVSPGAYQKWQYNVNGLPIPTATAGYDCAMQSGASIGCSRWTATRRFQDCVPRRRAALAGLLPRRSIAWTIPISSRPAPSPPPARLSSPRRSR